ncbi:hypothetical protein DSD19_04565 [Rhodovulum sp. BSW8]|nr:hypothetical protein DSD19_04565 [Rhodovulum sp. BSW8]
MTYAFRPPVGWTGDGTPPLVCDVNDPEHAKRLLSITEGFEAARGAEQPAPAALDNAGGGDDAQKGVPSDAAPEAVDDLTPLDRASLALIFKSHYGEEPRANMREDTLRRRIRSAREIEQGE